MEQAVQVLEELQVWHPEMQGTHWPITLMNDPAGQLQTPLMLVKLGAQVKAC